MSHHRRCCSIISARTWQVIGKLAILLFLARVWPSSSFMQLKPISFHWTQAFRGDCSHRYSIGVCRRRALCVRGGGKLRSTAAGTANEQVVTEADAVPAGTSSLTASSFNLAKNIIGGGMLALPAGMGAGAGTGWIPAYAILLGSCFSSACTFYSLGKSTAYTKAANFKDLWGKTLGKKSAWVIDAAICLLCFGVCIMYSCFLGDIFASLGRMANVSWLPAWTATRTGAITGITGLVLLPLCLLRDLSALSYSSMLGIAAVLYVTLFTGIRYFDGSYAVGGKFIEAVSASTASSTPGLLGLGLGTCVLFNMCSTAFMAHPNAVKFYNDLKDKSTKRFLAVVVAGFATAAVVCAAAMGFGYATFGRASSGLILNNYHSSKDRLAVLARAATGISIIGSQPLLFTGLRESAFSTLTSFGWVKDINKKPRLWTTLSTLLLAAATGVAIVTPDVGLIVSLIGSLLGAGMVYSLPSIIQLKCLEQEVAKKAGGASIGRVKGREALYLRLMVLFGMLMTIGGTVVTLLSQFTNILG